MKSTRSITPRRGTLLTAGVLCALLVPGLALSSAVAADTDDGAAAPPDRSRQVTPPTDRREAAPPRRGRAGTPPDDLLRGPRVRPGDAGPGQPFGTPPDRRRGENAAPAIPPRVWFATLRELDVNDETRESIVSLINAFDGERTLFMEEHGEKIRELERAARLARQEAGDDNAEAVVKLREEIMALREKAPKVEDVQKKAFELLDAEQQTAMRERLQVLEERQRTAMERRQLERRERQAMGEEGMGEGAGRGRDGMTPPRGPARPGREGATPPQRPGREGTPPGRPGRGDAGRGEGDGAEGRERTRERANENERRRRQNDAGGRTGE